MTDETIRCSEPRPRIAVARDQNGNVFEAFELRLQSGQAIFVDIHLAELVGGIESVRQAISPHFMIVMETLK